MSSILFDMGSTYSYVSIQFAVGLYFVCNVLDCPTYVSTLVGDSVVVTHVYHFCLILFVWFQTWVGLIILDMFTWM